MSRFHFTVDAAMAEQQPVEQAIPGANFDGDVVMISDFTAWHESIPFVRRPELPNLFTNDPTKLNHVLLQIGVGGNGQISRIQVIGSSPAEQSVR